MYNRYIPQQDGTYRKDSIPTPPPPVPVPEPQRESGNHCPSPPSKTQEGAFTFLKQLIPQNLDTGDLLIILMLLLIAGDCEDSKNNWLLTLALYLFSDLSN